MKKFFEYILDVLLHPGSHTKFILTVGMFATLFSTYLFVYVTGGSQFVYAHTMYIPIVILAMIHGPKGGLVSGLIGGILLGPLMAIDVETGEAQDLMNWLFRLLMFMVVGGLFGLFASKIRLQAESIRNLALKNPETKLSLFTMANQSLKDNNFMNKYRKETYVFSIVNGSEIVEILGKKFYNQLIIHVMDQLLTHFSHQVAIYQIDTTKFVVMVEKSYQDDFPETLMKYFDSAFTIEKVPIHLSIVVGISASDKSILSKAEEAIIATITAKKNHLQVATFDKSLLPSTTDISILGTFKEALNNGELFLSYQPVHDIYTNKVVCIEALIRWNHPEEGLILPGKFIHLIENTQLINYLSEFVIRETFLMLKKLDKNVSVSVNLSANNFYSRFFINKVFAIVDEEKTNAKRMIFEITESILMEHPKKSVEIMNRFKSKGIRFAIDDFGTGYSSLAYINSFPVDLLKIDRFFIQQMNQPNVYKIIKSTIELAHELNFDVVAEGVEKNSDIETLRALSCNFIQGFSKSVPLKEREILLYIKDNELIESS